MSKIKFISVLKEGHGRMKDVVFNTRNGEAHMYQYEKRKVTLNENQEKVRDAFVKLVDDWKGLHPVVRKSWEGRGDSPNASGYNTYIGDNSPRHMNAEPLRVSRKLGQDSVLGFQASPGNAAGEIACGFEPVNGGRHLTFLVQEKGNGTASGPFRRFDGGADCPAPFTITGLKPGSEYFVYALVTDNPLEQAMLVSESVGALTSAAQ